MFFGQERANTKILLINTVAQLPAGSGIRYMANAGMAIKDLQYLMGHSNADVTLNVYTHASYAHAEDITVPDKWKGAKVWLRLHRIYTNWP